ncbi:FtsW/RodA/SpoVE family cell cycle protein [Massilia sp. GCM10020059]|uniref:Probable peptidoglycan glycosyltransferase FtsW n=1 Tax=Massilia agrisoli TaxID=2892444 RepID=A0ABS8IWS4_9BURK|nr:FtsW/RodA/SpoVE family cell cycle protein [Massilia agrisoli]MCC6072333.1 FtsW/RodA/SpoVE family cell cycle protein [Massilia agrisoli]
MKGAIAIPVLAILCLLQLLGLLRAPALWSPASIAVTLAPGATATLGQRELAAPLADPEHIRIRRGADGVWWVRNTSAGKPLTLERGAHKSRTGTARPAAGQRLRIGRDQFTITSASARELSFTGAGSTWRYDGAVLLRDGHVQPSCPGPLPASALWNRVAPRALAFARPLSFGGNLHCDNRLGAAYVAPASALIQRVDGALQVVAGTADGQRVPLMLDDGGAAIDLGQQEVSLAGVDAIVAGRTRLTLSADGARLLLEPQRHIGMYTEPRVLLPAGVQWEWRQRQLWPLPAPRALASAAVLLLIAAAVAFASGSWPFVRGVSTHTRVAAGANLMVALCGVACLLMLRSGQPPGAGVSAVLGCAALWSCLLSPGRPGIATLAGLMLVGVGLLAQLELGLAAMESSMLRHFQKTAALLAIGLGAGTFIRLRLRARATLAPQASIEYCFAVLAAGALVALVLQVVFGDETGVFDVQPVEFAKLALTVLTAHCLAIGLGWHAGPADASLPRRWFRLGAPVLLFLALTGFALVQVDDYSPLILLGVWAVAMTFAWALATRRPACAAALSCAMLAIAGAIALMRGAGPQQLADLGFYADRFMVWLDPATHPHTGQQLLLGARAIAEGAWLGSDSVLGIAKLGLPGSSALQVPAVQDDFAPSFFLNRHGLAAGLALWALQALFVIGLLHTAARAHVAASATRDFRQAWLGRFRCFALCGGAAFVLGHFILSWGTNLAIFPVMGQPMSFLSAGGSHLLFFICPLLIFGAISTQSLEESRDAGLCPT